MLRRSDIISVIKGPTLRRGGGPNVPTEILTDFSTQSVIFTPSLHFQHFLAQINCLSFERLKMRMFGGVVYINKCILERFRINSINEIFFITTEIF